MDKTLVALRREARAFEKALPASKRKALGQFFTGVKLGRVLAHLAIEDTTRRIIDPMAGSGDLLDATCEAARSRATVLERLDAIEVDPAAAKICQRRLRYIAVREGLSFHVLNAEAFDPTTYEPFPETGYDMVMANPPYVRYQAMKDRAEKARRGLLQLIARRLTGTSRRVWTALASRYSGFADLSVPAWLLCSLLVRAGGRLAIVAPTTWRSRSYADVIRYLLLRCFSLEIVIEDTQPSWFSDALVRTHLIVARRLSDNEITAPLSVRTAWPTARWIEVAPDAATSESLVGSAFDGEDPEPTFAAWCWDSDTSRPHGINARQFSLENEWASLRQQAWERDWMAAVEPKEPNLPLFAKVRSHAAAVPEALRDLVPLGFDPQPLRRIEDIGMRTGQGLRTGCNRFFYVRAVEEARPGFVTVTTNAAYGSKTLQVPADAVRPVLHRQADLEAWRCGVPSTTHALDLRGWVLPEDLETVLAAQSVYEQARALPPQPMPHDFADYVRTAGNEPLGEQRDAKPVSAFSAVRTNIRPSREKTPPRFWYMLPDFTPRHLPKAFVPRILHGAPQVHENTDPPVLIDANFSTFWSQQPQWSKALLTAFLNSIWCRAVMEAVGTPLGGGALKLEVVHLRHMPVPVLDPHTLKKLEAHLRRQKGERRQELVDRVVLSTLLPHESSRSEIDAFAKALGNRLGELCAARQRGVR